jgi:uncharacterized protein (DUF433 family)
MPAIFQKYPRIVADIEYCDGKARIDGTRITVFAILYYFAGGMTTDNILVAFPQLQQEDISQALSYVAYKFKES